MKNTDFPWIINDPICCNKSSSQGCCQYLWVSPEALRGRQKPKADLSPSQGEQFGTEKGIRHIQSQLGAKQPEVKFYYCSNPPAVGGIHPLLVWWI